MIHIEKIDRHHHLLDDVIKLGDQNNGTLGHFPRGAFVEQARKKWIFIAREKSKLLGYLMFRFTQKSYSVKITHLCICEEYRGKGISSKLVDALKNEFLDKCKGIELRCREDYRAASKFWKKYGFIPKDEKLGRGKDEKKLIVWYYHLGLPDLFSAFVDNSKIRVLLDSNIIIKFRDQKREDDFETLSLQASWLDAEVEYYFAQEAFNRREFLDALHRGSLV